MSLKALLVALSLANVAHAAQPTVGFDSTRRLAKAAVAEFLKQANSPHSKVAGVLKSINDESIDGRNEDGVVPKPVKTTDLQVLVTDAEESHNPWHYGEVVKGWCEASGDSVSVLIAVSTHQGVHNASEFGTIAFKMTATDTMKAKVLSKNPGDVNCEDLNGFDGTGRPSDFGREIDGVSFSSITRQSP